MLILKANGELDEIELSEFSPQPTVPDDFDDADLAQRIRFDVESVSDGRVFSIVRLLRLKGYQGEILLTGLGQDQAILAFGVGADAISLRAGEKTEEWLQSMHSVSAFYGPRAEQANTGNIIRRRHGG